MICFLNFFCKIFNLAFKGKIVNFGHDSVVIKICEALLYRVLMYVHMLYQIYTVKMVSYRIKDLCTLSVYIGTY